MAMVTAHIMGWDSGMAAIMAVVTGTPHAGVAAIGAVTGGPVEGGGMVATVGMVAGVADGARVTLLAHEVQCPGRRFLVRLSVFE